ncbi:MAG: alkaline phosphatase family protein, partial [Methanomicrobiales archaeon]|nr:alkaline phosphatase family protein [Methanomicrobiales archaeon]
TLFERLREYYGEEIKLIMVASKGRNLGTDAGYPFHNAGPVLDYYENHNGDANVTGAYATEALDQYANDTPFFAFFHFRDPEEAGHLYREGSPQYRAALVRVDRRLGRIVANLKAHGLLDTTAVFVTTDHGFNRYQRTHHGQRQIWFVAGESTSLHGGDQKDIVPTILERFGIDQSIFSPQLPGRSLYVSARGDKVTANSFSLLVPSWDLCIHASQR